MCCHVCRQASWHGSEFAAITHILRLGEDREKELTTCRLPPSNLDTILLHIMQKVSNNLK